jgi:hypothetical protein
MPFTACIIFLAPLLIFLHLLDKVPPPSPLDEQLRTKRKPMTRRERIDFLKTFLPGIVLFVLSYVLLTTFRDFRENFSAEVWKTVGYGNSPQMFANTEIPVSFLVLVIIAMTMGIKSNFKAFMVNHIIIAAGMIVTGFSTLLFQKGLIEAPAWMLLIGLGLYLGYVPFNSIFFDRLIATFRYTGTVGFIMYVADSMGYLGSISMLFLKEFSYPAVSWLNVFIQSAYIISVTGLLLILGSMLYFYFKYNSAKPASQL